MIVQQRLRVVIEKINSILGDTKGIAVKYFLICIVKHFSLNILSESEVSFKLGSNIHFFRHYLNVADELVCKDEHCQKVSDHYQHCKTKLNEEVSVSMSCILRLLMNIPLSHLALFFFILFLLLLYFIIFALKVILLTFIIVRIQKLFTLIAQVYEIVIWYVYK